ncbi:MAG TPA: adenosine deaminase [Drouetiella sp.]
MNDSFIASLPKAELHLHIEGTFEPELIFKLAERNKITIPYASVDALRQAYQFEDLQSFLNLYYQCMNVLRTEEDFAELANSYFERASKQNVVHAEIFFDPQAHTSRGVPFRTVIDGLWSAVKDSKKNFGITTKMIMCFLRDLSAESAMETLDQAIPFGDRIVAVGLDSAERGNPPSKFAEVFAKARAAGFEATAHAGEEGPAEYVWEALNILKVKRIDHGVRSMEDQKLVQHLVETATPLTVCPLSNIKLRVFDKLKDHNLKKMLDAGLKATINSDDPAYFGGYIAENFRSVSEALNLNQADLQILAKNSINASFLSSSERSEYLALFEKN